MRANIINKNVLINNLHMIRPNIIKLKKYYCNLYSLLNIKIFCTQYNGLNSQHIKCWIDWIETGPRRQWIRDNTVCKETLWMSFLLPSKGNSPQGSTSRAQYYYNNTHYNNYPSLILPKRHQHYKFYFYSKECMIYNFSYYLFTN